MRNMMLGINMLMLTIGCATVSRNSSEASEIVTLVPCETPSFVLGEPVSNAELASDIAEYVLAEKGFDCRNRDYKVSFCEGVYSVAFFSGGERPEKAYAVDIDADTSRILSVRIFKSPCARGTRGSDGSNMAERRKC